MQRTALIALGLWGVVALSCQVLPSAGEPPASISLAGAVDAPRLATEAIAPAGPSLEETVASIEGSSLLDGMVLEVATHEDVAREAAIRHAEAFLHARHTALSTREIHEVARTIVDEATNYQLDVGVVLAVIQVESAGYHRAVSPVGAIGLMQIMPATGRALARQHGVDWHGSSTLFNPAINVRLGIAYLYELSDRYDHLPTALAAYNWGPGRIDSRIRRRSAMPEIYVKQVMRAYDRVSDAS
jgi:hypothetical protein